VRRIIWTDEAVANLEAIAAYINEFSPAAAHHFASSLERAADSLASLPDRGRSIQDGMRELTVIHPSIIRYRADETTVYVLRIRHGARLQD
jgi:plasmid stabilization system protein ParE